MLVKSNKLYALVDCNSFYCSCERVFRADLIGRPIAILSNNDGCIVALSKEAKEVGLKRCDPYFKHKKLIDDNGVAIFSSNYSLYSDMSSRVMEILTSFSPGIEIYSIDEAFLDLTGIDDPESFGKEIVKKVYRYTGIPVSVGIGATKTLAKLANHIGKSGLNRGVAYFDPKRTIDHILKDVAVGDIWGVGGRSVLKLKNRGIYTALELKNCSEEWVRKHLGGVVGLRTLYELNGIECYQLEDQPLPKKGIVSSRSFGTPVTTLEDMREAISTYVARASAKLRKQNSKGSSLTIYIKTNRFKDEPQYNNSITFKLPEPSNNTLELTSYGLKLLGRIFKDGFKYKSAGVMIDGIVEEEFLQPSLFSNSFKGEKISSVIDRINGLYGEGAIKTASSGLGGEWRMKRDMLSSSYTTNIKEILKVKI
jgi:DNA polymerase V